MQTRRGAYSVFMANPEGKRPLGRRKRMILKSSPSSLSSYHGVGQLVGPSQSLTR